MISRLAAATVALVLTVAMATGCSSPAPAPVPSPSFTSDDQAFAAAEATYRAYVDALNKVDLSDPSTFEGVYAWTTGEANSVERKNLSKMHADRWAVSGSTSVGRFRGNAFNPSSTSFVSATVCSDVSDVIVTDANGKSMVAPDRQTVYSLNLEFAEDASSPTGLLIMSSNAVADDLCVAQ